MSKEKKSLIVFYSVTLVVSLVLEIIYCTNEKNENLILSARCRDAVKHICSRDGRGGGWTLLD